MRAQLERTATMFDWAWTKLVSAAEVHRVAILTGRSFAIEVGGGGIEGRAPRVKRTKKGGAASSATGPQRGRAVERGWTRREVVKLK